MVQIPVDNRNYRIASMLVRCLLKIYQLKEPVPCKTIPCHYNQAGFLLQHNVFECIILLALEFGHPLAKINHAFTGG